MILYTWSETWTLVTRAAPRALFLLGHRDYRYITNIVQYFHITVVYATLHNNVLKKGEQVTKLG